MERSELPVERYDLGIKHVLVTLESPEAVARLEPDMTGLARLTGLVGANCFAGSGTQWKTRMFAPGDGIPEDPATGSAAGPIACHLARYGRTSFGDTLELTQGVEAGRPSKLYARAEGTADEIDGGRGRRLGGRRGSRRVSALGHARRRLNARRV